MRRNDREVTSFQQKLEILDQCKILRLAMMDGDGLYIVPVSFGYINQKEQLSFYLHSAKEGRKVAAMSRGCDVAFELDCQFQLQEGQDACHYSCLFASLIGTGKAALVEDPTEKAEGLAAIMRQQTGKEFTFTREQTDMAAVFRIDVETMTGKRKA